MPLTQGQQQSPLYPVICGVVNLNTQAAVLGTTIIFPNAPPGIYHANTCLIVTATGTSGNLVANILVTDDLQAETIPGATIAAITSTGQANSCLAFENAATNNISFSVTASGTFGSCRYSLYLVLERLF